MAHGLDIALSGPRSYEGEMRDFPWVNGAGRRDLGADDIDHSITVLWRTWGVAIGSAILFWLIPVF